MINIDPKAIILSILNFLVIIWVLNVILYRPIRQILIQRKQKFSSLDQTITAAITNAGEKDLAYDTGIKNARAQGLKEKDVFLQNAAEEERDIIEQINLKNRGSLAEVQAKISKDAEAAKAALLQEVDAFAEIISLKILGRTVS